MGILKQLFGKERPEGLQKDRTYPWKPLAREEQLSDIRKASEDRPQIIYKHSTSCGISSMVFRMLEDSFPPTTTADLYFLDLHRYRPVSDSVEKVFGHRHESPQLLIIKSGEVIAAASHGAITELDIHRFV